MAQGTLEVSSAKMSVDRCEEDTSYMGKTVEHMNMRTIVKLSNLMVEAFMAEKTSKGADSPAIWLNKRIAWNKFPSKVELFEQCADGVKSEKKYWQRVYPYEVRIAANKALVEICFGLELIKSNLEVLPPEPSPVGGAIVTSSWREGFGGGGERAEVVFSVPPPIKRKHADVEAEILPITSCEE